MNAELLLLIPGLAVVIAIAGLLSWIDYREHRLPNRIVAPLAAGVAVWLLILGLVTSDIGRSATAIAWGFGAFVVFLVLHFAAGLGMGDVKYAWPIAATLGWFGSSAIEVAVYALILSGGAVGLLSMARGQGRNHRIAYGPFMSIGLVAGLIYAFV